MECYTPPYHSQLDYKAVQRCYLSFIRHFLSFQRDILIRMSLSIERETVPVFYKDTPQQNVINHETQYSM